jgi:hypothetical protein
MFRFYRSNQGRFLSPDPVTGDLLNPQSWNRYAYVLNNPANLTDPLGLIQSGKGCYDAYNYPMPCGSDQPPNFCNVIVCAQPGVPGTNPYDIPPIVLLIPSILPNIAPSN